MSSKNHISFIFILYLVAQLFFFGYVTAESRADSSGVLQRQTFLPGSVPEKDRLILVSFLPVIVEGKIVGRVAVYDDPRTERPADYLELYNSTDGLLAVNWFDRFGIERIAVDRGLLGETHRLQGVFVLLLDGDSI